MLLPDTKLFNSSILPTSDREEIERERERRERAREREREREKKRERLALSIERAVIERLSPLSRSYRQLSPLERYLSLSLFSLPLPI